MTPASLKANQLVHGNTHDCQMHITNEKMSVLSRLRACYIRNIQAFSQYLFKKGWVIPHYLVGSLFAEPGTVAAASTSGLCRRVGLLPTWQKHGFFDAGNPESIKALIQTVKAQIAEKPGVKLPPPVLLFHGVMSTPEVWLPWASTLTEAKNKGQIGQVITLQLTNEMSARMKEVRNAIAAVVEAYKLAGHEDVNVDLIGHSKGGYAAHLAAFKKETIYDDAKIERRWHNHERNPLVRKVISIGASTWLCCMGQKDDKGHDIYPEGKFTEAQRETIQRNHEDIVDIVPTEDAICVTESPLPFAQVYKVRHGHLGVLSCPDVCRLAVSILAKKN